MFKSRSGMIIAVIMMLSIMTGGLASAQNYTYNSGDNVTSNLDTGLAGRIDLGFSYAPGDPPATENGAMVGSGDIRVTSANGGALNLRGDNRAFTGHLYLNGGGLNLADDGNLIGAMGNIVFSYPTAFDPITSAAPDLRDELGGRVAAGSGGVSLDQVRADFWSAVDRNITFGSLGYIQIDAGADITVNGNAVTPQNLSLVIDQAGQIQALAGSTLTYNGHSRSGGQGGALLLNQAIALDMRAEGGARFIFSDNNAGYGGAIEVNQSLLTLNQADFNQNQAVGSSSRGGAIEVRSGSLLVDDASFNSNVSGRSGGAIENQTGDIWIRDGVFTANTANSGEGGALSNRGVGGVRSTAYLEDSRFTGNATLSLGGGALFNLRSDLLITGSTFSGNRSSDYDGGALYNNLGLANIENTDFIDNRAKSNGGAIYNNNRNTTLGDQMEIKNGEFSGNQAGQHGGAIYNLSSYLGLENLTFADNSAGTFGNGGAIYNQYDDIYIRDSSFIGNQAGRDGGAVYNWAATITLDVTDNATSTFSGNTARGRANSFHLYGTGAKDSEFLAYVGNDAVLDMKDPISGVAGSDFFTSRNVIMQKVGNGLWKLGGLTAILNEDPTNSVGAYFHLNAGALHLYGAGETTNGDSQVEDGAVSLEGTISEIYIGANTTLTMGGQNGLYITDSASSPASGQAQGRIDFAGDTRMGFDLSRQSAGQTSLELKAADIHLGGTIDIDILAMGGTGRYVLLHKNSDATGDDFNNSNIDTLNLTYRGHSLTSLNRGLSTGFNVYVEDENTVVLENNFENRVLTWTNSADNDWSLDGDGWTDEDLNAAQLFFDGDAVNLDGQNSINYQLDVEDDGLIIADMFVSGNEDYAITGGGLTTSATATTLTNAAGKLILGRKAQADGLGGLSINESLFTKTLDLTGQTEDNNFTDGVDIHSGGLRVNDLGQLGGDLGGLKLMSLNTLWNTLDSALDAYVTTPDATGLGGLGAALTTARNSGLATLRLAQGSGLNLDGQRLLQTRNQGGNIHLEGTGDLTWSGSRAAANGGAIETVADSFLALSAEAGGVYRFVGNSAAGAGGAIYNQGDFLALGAGNQTFWFSANLANNRGGAIVNEGLMSLNQAVFNRNRSLGDGGAIYNTGRLALTDFRFQNNVVGTTGRGGAIYNSGELSLTAADIASESYFGDNRTSGGLNSIFMESGSSQAVLNLITENNAALWMYDPMAGQAGAAGILINKDGAGVWGLSGNNNFLSSGGGTVMNVNEGSLLLSGGGARNSFRSDQANIHLAGSSSQFNLGAATLVVGGDNQILSDGQVNLNAGAVITVEGGRPASLTLNQAYLNGPVEFDIGTGERLALEAVLTGAGDLDKTGDGSLVLARTGHNFGDLTLTGGTLGLVASESEAALTVNSVTFNTGTTLDISGFSGEEFGQRVTLIVSNDDILFNEPGNQPKVTIGQNATVDFLTTQVELANNDKHLDAIIGLTWYDPSTDGTGSYDLAHGDFTLNDPSGGFKLEAQLNDRAGVFDSGWDGKSLTKKGQGILLLTADNTYSGRTTIEDGTLAIYSLDSSGLNQTDKEVEIQANGTLEINVDSDGDYRKLLTGGGGLIKNGTGDVTLANDNSGLSGTVQVNGGGLTAVRAGSLGTGEVENNALVSLRYDGLFENKFSGGGTLAAYGDLTLTGDHSGHNGILAIQFGELRLGGPYFVSEAEGQVSSGAVLAGQGRLGSLIVKSGGMVSPGQSIGTINISNDLEFQAGGIYMAEVDLASGRSDLLMVDGQTSINPSALLRPTILNGEAMDRGTQYRFKIIGDDTFADDSLFSLQNRLGWSFSQSLEADGLYLVLLRNGGAGGGVSVWVCSVGTPNACRTAEAYDRMVSSGQAGQLGFLGQVLDDLSLADPNYVAESFLKLSGEFHPSLSGAIQEHDQDFVRQLRGQIAPPQGGWPLWLTVSGLENRGQASSHFAKGKLRGAEAVLGTSKQLPSDWILGGALRFGSYDYDYRWDSADVNGFTGALFAEKSFQTGADSLFKLYLGASYGRHEVDAKRRVNIVGETMGFHSSPKSDYTISNFQVFTEAAYLMPLTTCLDIEPYLGLGWSNLQREGFTEKHGQEANLKAKGLKEDRFASELGFRLHNDFQSGLNLSGNLGWRHRYGHPNHRDEFSFAALPDERFYIDGAPQSRDALVVGLETGYNFASGLSLKAGYDGSLGNNSDNHSGRLNLIFQF